MEKEKTQKIWKVNLIVKKRAIRDKEMSPEQVGVQNLLGSNSWVQVTWGLLHPYHKVRNKQGIIKSFHKMINLKDRKWKGKTRNIIMNKKVNPKMSLIKMERE